jgi:phage terminase Nu1 subunit (DNA packaging protein)
MDTIGVRTLSEITGLSPRRLQQMVKEGTLPQPEARNQYPFPDVMIAFVEHLYSKISDSDSKKKADLLLDQEIRLKTAQADAKEIQVKQLRRELVPADAVKRERATLIINAKSKLRAIPNKIAPKLDALATVHEKRDLLTDEIDQALDELRLGTIDPAILDAVDELYHTLFPQDDEENPAPE